MKPVDKPILRPVIAELKRAAHYSLPREGVLGEPRRVRVRSGRFTAIVPDTVEGLIGAADRLEIGKAPFALTTECRINRDVLGPVGRARQAAARDHAKGVINPLPAFTDGGWARVTAPECWTALGNASFAPEAAFRHAQELFAKAAYQELPAAAYVLVWTGLAFDASRGISVASLGAIEAREPAHA